MIPELCSTDPAAICCESWFAITENLVIAAGTAVQECNPQCAEIPYYVSHAEPIGWGDYLAGWLAGVEPIALSPKSLPRMRLTLGFMLCQQGYPGPKVSGNGIEAVPSPAEHTHASYFSYGVAEIAFRSMVGAVATGVMGACSDVLMGTLRPDPPTGTPTSARWRWQISALYDLSDRLIRS